MLSSGQSKGNTRKKRKKEARYYLANVFKVGRDQEKTLKRNGLVCSDII